MARYVSLAPLSQRPAITMTCIIVTCGSLEKFVGTSLWLTSFIWIISILCGMYQSNCGTHFCNYFVTRLCNRYGGLGLWLTDLRIWLAHNFSMDWILQRIASMLCGSLYIFYGSLSFLWIAFYSLIFAIYGDILWGSDLQCGISQVFSSLRRYIGPHQWSALIRLLARLQWFETMVYSLHFVASLQCHPYSGISKVVSIYLCIYSGIIISPCCRCFSMHHKNSTMVRTVTLRLDIIR